MSEQLTRLRRDYAPPFLAHLTRQDEAGLRSAYELGRQAMSAGVSLLDLVRVHTEILLEVMHTARSLEEGEEIARAAGAFLLETLASFEMTQRGFMDQRDAGA
jgi:hypothetical protein